MTQPKRVTEADLHDEVLAVQYHVFPDTLLTVCAITMKNGFTVTGTSACVDPDNFNQRTGETIAFAEALNKMWPLLGFRLRDRLAAEEAA